MYIFINVDYMFDKKVTSLTFNKKHYYTYNVWNYLEYVHSFFAI